MKIVFKNKKGEYFQFNDRNSISLPAGLYQLAYIKLSESELDDGDRLDNRSPFFLGEIEEEGEYTILRTGAYVEFAISGYNDYDRCDPYILRSVITIT